MNEWDEDTNDTILKNCPFCGAEVKQSEDNDLECEIWCENCNASMYMDVDKYGKDYRKKCIKAWNARV